MAQSVKHLTSAQVMISWFMVSSSTSCSVLIAQSLEPTYPSLSLCLSLSLSAPPPINALSLSLSLSKINIKLKQKRLLVGERTVLQTVVLGGVSRWVSRLNIELQLRS